MAGPARGRPLIWSSGPTLLHYRERTRPSIDSNCKSPGNETLESHCWERYNDSGAGSERGSSLLLVRSGACPWYSRLARQPRPELPTNDTTRSSEGGLTTFSDPTPLGHFPPYSNGSPPCLSLTVSFKSLSIPSPTPTHCGD